MFSCNEKTKKSEYIYLYIQYMNKYIYIWETDRHEARLVEGRVGAGELIHWPLSLWVTLLLSFCALVSLRLPSSSSSSCASSSHLPTQVTLSLPPPPPRPSSGGAESFHFVPSPCQNTSMSKRGGGTWREDLILNKVLRKERRRQKKAPFGLYWEAAVVVRPRPGTPHPLDARSSASAASVAEKDLLKKTNKKTHW